ncbi:MAG: hypothetical protein B6245_07760 [Desulfobacteraceae bacterium 4572_88]|nr:MAG: hypothetical protein B6245_07760 [Desulfobacteraceae bacterium 4572_88]
MVSRLKENRPLMSNKKLVASPDKQLSMLKLDKKEEKAIFRAARILKEKYPVKQVILFGSKARGDDEEGSDIDLFLLTSRPLHWKEREHVIGELFDIEIEFDVVISILDTTISEWHGGIFKYFPIRDNIYHEGVVAV